MTTRTKKLFIVVIAIALLGCSAVAWTAAKVVAWARDLPNRIVIDGDGMADAFGKAVVLSYHEGLNNGDARTQTEIIDGFTAMTADDAVAKEWVRTEYTSDLQQLATSSNEEVAALANELLTQLATASIPDLPGSPSNEPK